MLKKLSPQYILGFVDGEGSFHIAIYQDAKMKTGLKIIPEFHVSQRYTSIKVLKELNNFFRCGYIKANHSANPKDTTYVYVVRDRQDLLKIIIPFFEKNILRSAKAKDFTIFAKIVRQMELGRHRSISGVKKILNLAYQMNNQGRYRRKKHKLS